jgi:branched-chain amino acid transport system ATP-binding protein
MTALLDIASLHATYNHAIVALQGVSLSVAPGEIVALLGANGAGKSTTLQAVANLLPAQRGQVTGGRILFDGRDITHATPARTVQDGLVSVLEGRHVFRSLTIHENLLSGAAAKRLSRAETRREADRVYAIFPRLRDKRTLPAGLASGGEQQMVAMGRALMCRPRLLVLDEPSMGLAPRIVEEIFAVLRALNKQDGVAILLAEQNTAIALRIAHRGAVLQHGAIALQGTAAELRARDDIRAFYLGLDTPRADAGRVAESV